MLPAEREKAFELAEIIEKTNKDGTLPKITDGYSGEETVWDYRNFDMAYCNMFFKNDVLGIQTAYEMYE